MDAVPRISRAQSMDVLSSMANVAGYRAVIEAAHEFGRLFTGQVTAAGKVPPARVFVVGAGVAGLAAIGAAGSMGAIVRAFDVRPEVAEQVESMGAQFVDASTSESEVSSDGYAKEMTAEQEAATAAMYDEEARAADIVITTALIPGRPAPQLVTAETVAGDEARLGHRRHGRGQRRQRRRHRDRRAGGHRPTASRSSATPTSPAGCAAQTRQLYGTNIVNLLKLLTPEKDGVLALDMDDVDPARHHRRPGRRDDVAAAARAGLGRPGGRAAGCPAGAGGEAAAGPAGGSSSRGARRRSLFALIAAYSPPRLPGPLHGLRAGDRRRLLRHLQRRARPAHAADVARPTRSPGSSWSAAILQVGSDNARRS